MPLSLKVQVSNGEFKELRERIKGFRRVAGNTPRDDSPDQQHLVVVQQGRRM